jgi:hypothetical protein
MHLVGVVMKGKRKRTVRLTVSTDIRSTYGARVRPKKNPVYLRYYPIININSFSKKNSSRDFGEHTMNDEWRRRKVTFTPVPPASS